MSVGSYAAYFLLKQYALTYYRPSRTTLLMPIVRKTRPLNKGKRILEARLGNSLLFIISHVYFPPNLILRTNIKFCMKHKHLIMNIEI
jgi:hypothetical protein